MKFASASGQLSCSDSRKFDTIAKNINKLSTLNTQQLKKKDLAVFS